MLSPINKLFFACNTNNCCYIDNNSQLWLSKLDGSADILFDLNKDFVDSICLIKIYDKTIVINTLSSDIYYFDISDVGTLSQSNLHHLGTYKTNKLVWYTYKLSHYLFLVCDATILLFIDYKLEYTHTLEITDGESIQYFSFVKGFLGLLEHCVTTDVGLSYIINANLIKHTRLPGHFLNVSLVGDNYWCRHSDGHIIIYDKSWNYIQKINLEIITVPNIVHRISFIDSDYYYYYLYDGLVSQLPANTTFVTSVTDTKHIVKYDNAEKILTETQSCYHLDICRCTDKYIYAIFESSISIFDIKRSQVYTQNFDFNNYLCVTKFGKNGLLLIDYDGVMSVVELDINIYNKKVTLANKYVHDNNIKLSQVTTIKKAI
jgi:hypothetical protein